jgi:hypothetical protein
VHIRPFDVHSFASLPLTRTGAVGRDIRERDGEFGSLHSKNWKSSDVAAVVRATLVLTVHNWHISCRVSLRIPPFDENTMLDSLYAAHARRIHGKGHAMSGTTPLGQFPRDAACLDARG